jgi:multidrug efflux pump subunit AcrA (membrane-fusion protein)
MNATPSLTALSRGGAAVPRPPIRWKTRVLLPFAILVAAAGLLGYAARSALWPSIDVWVVPVVAKPVVGGAAAPAGGQGGPRSGAPGQGQILVQAPGWVEPSPYAINVPALTEGVVKEVLVLEGQSVMEGQPVARLIDEDAKLVLLRAEAELVERRAEGTKAEAELAAAVARVNEVKDEVDRKRGLVQAGGISEGQFARLELRLASMNKEIEAARAAVNAAGAAVNTHEVLCTEARLALERTEVRAPASGVVLSRLVEPGSRISMAKSGDAMAGTVARLYDPEFLQVRVEVPLGDVAKIGVGTPAEIVTEALPDTVFRGRIIRVVHEANIQRNTVQVKVSIDQPVPTLKPEMLTRVRFYSVAAAGKAGRGTTCGCADRRGGREIAGADRGADRSQG